jgi:hypothetical protein
MGRSAHELKNYVSQASDGEIGRCTDFLFDDHSWSVRYLVADTPVSEQQRSLLTQDTL